MQRAKATNGTLQRIELAPGTGSPLPGSVLQVPGSRAWRVAKLALPWCDFERRDHRDVCGLPGDRRDMPAMLGEAFSGG
jgi:hypothetical protein